MEHGSNVIMEQMLEKYDETINATIMNKNKSVEQLADEIFNRVNEPKQLTLKEELVKNSYRFGKHLEEDIILNQAVISYQTMVDGDSTVIMPQRPAGVARQGIPNSILPYLNTVEGTNSFLSYIYESNKTEGVAVRAENAKMSQSDRVYTEVDSRASNVSGWIDVSNESMKDVEFLKTEIEIGLQGEMNTILSNLIINGNGTYPQFKGLLNVATAFSAGTHATKVTGATLADVLKVAGNQILTAGFTPSLAIVHPDDYTTLSLGNDATRTMPWIVVPSTLAGTGNYILLDGSLVMLFLANQKIIFSDQNQDNALYERTSVIGNLHANLKIAPNQYTGIVKGVFATDLAAIKATT